MKHPSGPSGCGGASGYGGGARETGLPTLNKSVSNFHDQNSIKSLIGRS
jgi:hypothetical protein